jgi:hypothetical protein
MLNAQALAASSILTDKKEYAYWSWIGVIHRYVHTLTQECILAKDAFLSILYYPRTLA